MEVRMDSPSWSTIVINFSVSYENACTYVPLFITHFLLKIRGAF